MKTLKRKKSVRKAIEWLSRNHRWVWVGDTEFIDIGYFASLQERYIKWWALKHPTLKLRIWNEDHCFIHKAIHIALKSCHVSYSRYQRIKCSESESSVGPYPSSYENKFIWFQQWSLPSDLRKRARKCKNGGIFFLNCFLCFPQL